MMKYKITRVTGLLLTLLCLMNPSHAQKLNLKWSDEQIYDNKVDGFFERFEGSNSKYIYARVATIVNSTKAKHQSKKKVVLQAIERGSMKKVAQTVLYNPKDKAAREKHKGMLLHRIIVFEDIVYVFWIKSSDTREELYAQTFDQKLKKINSLKKIYELPNINKRRTRDAEIFVLANEKAGQKILIGGELSTEKDQNVKVEYKVLNKDFSFDASNRLDLSVKLLGTSSSLSSSYTFGDDGNLHIKTNVIDEEEGESKSKLRKRKWDYVTYPVLSIVDVPTGQIKAIPFKFEDKNIFDFHYAVEKDYIHVTGFFCDLAKDPKGRTTHGIFTCNVKTADYTIENNNFTYFEKALMDELFARDKTDQVVNKRKRKKEKGPDENSLLDSYTIEQTAYDKSGNVILFCSIMNNYAVTSCSSGANGGQTCTTRYYCNKRNVTVFCVTPDGKLVWASNVNRDITYNGWNKYDVKFISDNNKYYVTYGSTSQDDASKKSGQSNKSKKQIKDTFEYAVFDAGTGKYSKEEYRVNEINTPKNEKKVITASRIQVVGNEMYTNYTRTKRKTLPTVLTCAGALVCFPIILNLYNPKIRKGYGYYGKITPAK